MVFNTTGWILMVGKTNPRVGTNTTLTLFYRCLEHNKPVDKAVQAKILRLRAWVSVGTGGATPSRLLRRSGRLGGLRLRRRGLGYGRISGRNAQLRERLVGRRAVAGHGRGTPTRFSAARHAQESRRQHDEQEDEGEARQADADALHALVLLMRRMGIISK
jgi:hypothetical protein